ncbi:hypothetical protein Tco_0216695 [Tanacetum coccineum]
MFVEWRGKKYGSTYQFNWILGVGKEVLFCEKHSVGKCHIGTLGHTYHSVGDVVGKVEVFSNGEDDFPFLEMSFQLGDNHLKMIKGGFNPFHFSGLGLSPFIETNSVTDQKMILHIEGGDPQSTLTRKLRIQHKDGTHLFVYIEKAIKPNSREIRAKVGLIIKEGGVDNATFMDEM